MAKKIQLEFDIDGKDVKIVSDSVLTLTEQVRFLKKELQKVDESSPQFEILKNKFNETKDQLDKVNIKSREFFGTLSALPGPVGAFAGSLDNGIDLLKTFTSFSFKDIKSSLGEVTKDFGDIVSNIGKATGITKVYTVLNNLLSKSFIAVGVGEGAAAAGARAFAAALTATGIGAIVVALGMAVSALMDYANAAETAAEKQKQLNEAQDKMAKETLDVETQFVKRMGDLDVARAKSKGATADEIYKIEQQSRKLLLASQKRYLAELSNEYGEEGRKTVQTIKNTENEIKVAEANFQAQQLKDKEAADEKIRQKNEQHRQKLAQDNKTADDTSLSLARENSALAITDERKRQDKELENQKLAEEDKIKALAISQEKKNKIIAQIDEKYKYKQQDLNIKRKEEDKKEEDDRLKDVQEWTNKLKEIEITAIVDTTVQAKAERQKGYDDTKRDLDKALADKKISQDQYDTAIKNATIALNQDLKKIDDDKIKEDQDKRLKKLDDELKYLQIKGEVLRQGTKEFYDNQRAILDASEKRDLENTELTEAQKTAIIEKYAKLRKKLKEDEIAANWMVVSQTIDAVANLTNAIASSYDEEAKTSKAAFEQRKKLQIATAVMSAASGIIQILTQPSTLPSPFDWIVKGINAAALAISTGVQISNIKKTQFQASGTSASTAEPAPKVANYGDGGLIDGPRHAQGGTLINAEGGEAVMTRGAVTMFAPLLSALNQMGGGTAFAPNAMVTRMDNPKSAFPTDYSNQTPQIIKSYVVEGELTSAQQKQARLKDLSTI